MKSIRTECPKRVTPMSSLDQRPPHNNVAVPQLSSFVLVSSRNATHPGAAASALYAFLPSPRTPFLLLVRRVALHREKREITLFGDTGRAASCATREQGRSRRYSRALNGCNVCHLVQLRCRLHARRALHTPLRETTFLSPSLLAPATDLTASLTTPLRGR